MQLLNILGIIERNLPTFLSKIFSINAAPNEHKEDDLVHFEFIKKTNVLNDYVKITLK